MAHIKEHCYQAYGVQQEHQIAEAFYSLVRHSEKTTILVNKLPPSYTVEAVLGLVDGAGFAGWYTIHALPSAFVARYKTAVCLKFQDSSGAQRCANVLRDHSWPAKGPTIIQTDAMALQYHAANIGNLPAQADTPQRSTKPRRRKAPSTPTVCTTSGSAPPVWPKNIDEISQVETTASSPKNIQELSELEATGPSPENQDIEEASGSSSSRVDQRPRAASSRVRAQSADSVLLGGGVPETCGSTVLSCAGCRIVLRRTFLEVEYNDVDAADACASSASVPGMRPRARTQAEVLCDRGW